MGLDVVELVMEVEDHFNVRLPDSECARIRTVADLAALVIRRLPRDDGTCPTSRSFFAIRTLMVTHAGLQRKDVRPKTRLNDLFPQGSRRVWNSLRTIDQRLPRLTVHRRVDGILLVIAALSVLACPIAAGLLLAWQGASGAAPTSLIVFAAGLWMFHSLYVQFVRHFPEGLETVGDVARLITPIPMPNNSSGERLIAQQRVLEEVRVLTAQQLGLPLESVQPTSEFVKDLGAG